MLGISLRHGVGLLGWMLVACPAEDPPAPAPVAVSWAEVDGPAQRVVADRDCAGGDPGACWWLGAERRWGQPMDAAGAWAAWARGCDLGHGGSCVAAGEGRRLGRGVHQDLDAAAARYRAGCVAGLDVACEAEVSLRVSRTLLAACAEDAEGSCAAACRRLGAETACDRARDHARRACAAGEATSCTWLGATAARDAPGAVDADAVNGLLWRGCDLDDPWGCLQLADRLARGQGSNPSPKSLEWLYNQVCDLQLDYGCAPHVVPWRAP